MARKQRVIERKASGDPVYDSKEIDKFIRILMKGGKKSIAEKIVYGALQRIKEIKGLSNSDGCLEIFYKAIENVSPTVEVKAKRVGGSTYQIPVEVRPNRRRSLAVRWLIASAKSRRGKSMSVCLADEILEASENRGGAFKKKEEAHRMAEANKAFAHIRSNS
jgi:small subunit ribosomal protein S7